MNYRRSLGAIVGRKSLLSGKGVHLVPTRISQHGNPRMNGIHLDWKILFTMPSTRFNNEHTVFRVLPPSIQPTRSKPKALQLAAPRWQLIHWFEHFLLEVLMESKAKLLGHPIHPMLIVFPLGLLATSVAFDIVGLSKSDASWFGISYWMLDAGTI